MGGAASKKEQRGRHVSTRGRRCRRRSDGQDRSWRAGDEGRSRAFGSISPSGREELRADRQAGRLVGDQASCPMAAEPLNTGTGFGDAQHLQSLFRRPRAQERRSHLPTRHRSRLGRRERRREVDVDGHSRRRCERRRWRDPVGRPTACNGRFRKRPPKRHQRGVSGVQPHSRAHGGGERVAAPGADVVGIPGEAQDERGHPRVAEASRHRCRSGDARGTVDRRPAAARRGCAGAGLATRASS